MRLRVPLLLAAAVCLLSSGCDPIGPAEGCPAGFLTDGRFTATFDGDRYEATCFDVSPLEVGGIAVSGIRPNLNGPAGPDSFTLYAADIASGTYTIGADDDSASLDFSGPGESISFDRGTIVLELVQAGRIQGRFDASGEGSDVSGSFDIRY